jgi:putative restriction endonuclease
MAFGVFIHRADSIYDDNPAERYQFPRQYLGRASACVDDWIVYYEPRKAPGSRGYFAVAKVQKIAPDPTAADMYVALIAPGSYLDFASPVAFSATDGLVERGVLNAQGRISGRAQAAIRPLSAEDFNRIVSRGLAGDAAPLPREGELKQGLAEDQAPFRDEQIRERVEYLSSRIIRDRVFRQVVLRAYDSRCAITGLKLINGGGRAEVAAAHIRPVAENGPDIVSNGIALSGTVHWMFDRGLLSLSDDLTILLSRQLNDPDGVRALINKTGHVLPPKRTMECPHPAYLRWHRKHCFKH